MHSYKKIILSGFLFLGAVNSFGQTGNDATVIKAVQDRLSSEQSLANQNISVSASQGTVSLVGNLDTNEQANNAIQIAEATPGVKDVNYSGLIIKNSGQPLSDTAITAKVKGLFLKEKVFGKSEMPMMSIHVETKNGVVYLTGTALDKKQIKRATNLAQSVNGVKGVDAKISLKKIGNSF